MNNRGKKITEFLLNSLIGFVCAHPYHYKLKTLLIDSVNETIKLGNTQI